MSDLLNSTAVTVFICFNPDVNWAEGLTPG